MSSRIKNRAVLLAVALFVSLGATSAWSLAQITRQTLDRVDAFNSTAVLEMAFDDVNRTKDFINLGIVGTNFSTCKLTATDGIFCLAGKIVRNWPDPEDPLTFVDRLSCNDPALGLDTKKADTCTGMTVDLSGAIWLAGKKASTHSLIKVIAKAAAAACESGWKVLSGSLYCAKEFYAGRPLLVDIDPIDGDVGAAFKPCPSCTVQSGVLGLEERKTAVFFPDKPPGTSSPIVIASGQGWNLIGNEQLLSSALLQVPNGDSLDNFVLVTTTSGRILAKRTNVTETAFKVFNIPLERVQTSPQCAFGTQQYGIRASSKSGRVYVTDRNYCQVLALVPDASPMTALINDGDAQDLTLTTSDSSGTYPPNGPTLAPGISIDLDKDCSVNCTLLTNDGGDVAASLVAVRLANGSNSGATLFQIKGIPDCRYANEPNFPVALRTICGSAAGVIVNPDNVESPAAQLLNVTPLLPKEVRSLFDVSGVPPNGLPPLLISRQYRAQARTDFVFEAFFAVTEAGVRFRDTFTAEFDVPVLEGAPESLGCLPVAGNLLAWDVMTTVSEKFKTIDDQYVDMLTNIGCRNPTKTSGSRLSLLPYNLEIAPDTYGSTILSTVKSVTTGNDAVFARLVQSLYDDLDYVRRELACQQVDAGGGPAPPLSASVCNTLSSTWQNGKLKLDKCVSAAFQPKQSAGDENCQSFVSQLTNYRASLPATTSASDVANRLGELKTRVDVIRHVFDTRFLPSIPAAGFCRERNTNTCPP